MAFHPSRQNLQVGEGLYQHLKAIKEDWSRPGANAKQAWEFARQKASTAVLQGFMEFSCAILTDQGTACLLNSCVAGAVQLEP